jgi:alpha-beta hydrolase superfamily lysophospholipase
VKIRVPARPARPSRIRRIARAGGWTLLGTSVLAVVGCAAYSRVVEHRCQAWEAGMNWSADGVRAGCEPFALGKGPPTLLLVHGFGDNPAVWGPLARDWAARGYHCRAMRVPGFGDRLEARCKIDLEVWQDSLAGEVRALRGEAGEVWLVAHSLGAALAIRHALDHPGEVAGLALMAPLLRVSDRRSPVLGARAWFRLLGRHIPVAESPFPEDLFLEPPAGRPAVERFISANIYAALFELLDEIGPRAGQLRVPLWLATSPADQVADPQAAAAWFDATAASPRRRLVEAAGSGHVLPLDRDANWLADEVDRFIRGS